MDNYDTWKQNEPISLDPEQEFEDWLSNGEERYEKEKNDNN